MKAASYDVQPFPGTFKSSRPWWMATFMSADLKVISRRTDMELNSSRSAAPYKVFSEWVEAPPRKIARREQSSDVDALDLLNSVYSEA